MSATYTKLRTGDWGIRVQERAVAAGDVVTVHKRDGSTQQETVTNVLWQGVQGVVLCAIVPRERPANRKGGRAVPRCEFLVRGEVDDEEEACGHERGT